MGTLLNQPVRRWLEYSDKDIVEFIENAKAISKKTNLPIDQVLKVFEIREQQRKNNLMIHNGDIHDEQMSGFGELVKEAISTLDRLREALEN